VSKRVVEIRPKRIIVQDRHRTDLGDLTGLMESIKAVGMLQPIVVRATADEQVYLVAGQRRLEAAKRLGWSLVPCLMVDRLTDATKALTAERDENQCRKAMTPTELKSLTDALLEIEREEAKARQRAGQERGRAVQRGDVDHVVQNQDPQRAKAEAAKAVGWSRSQYERVERVERAASSPTLPESVRQVAADALKQLEAETMTPNQADKVVKDAKVAAGVGSTNDKIDKARRDNPKITRAGEQRLAEYEDLCRSGYSSRQIAERWGIDINGFWAFRKRHGLAQPPADEQIGRTRTHDTNRIVSETVASLEGICIGIQLVNFDDLAGDDLDYWVSSLTDSIRSLTTLRNNLKKELTQVA
jgi:ParB-like chromosome segregation protein Spo0J